MQMLSRAGVVRPFGAGADGIVAGEGVGAVLLRPLADAIAAEDRILGVIRGTAMNAGGRTAGYTVPSPDAQEALVASALRRARVDASAIGYVEAHGTGTALGDPIEVLALTRAFRRSTQARGYCALGSVKSNIGHLEAAAGIASLTKVLLAMRESVVPPTLHCDPPNPHIDFAGSPFFLADRLREWPEIGGARRAGISSFGAGGTNVHVVVESFAVRRTAVSNGREVVPLSARSEERLRESAGRLAEWLERNPEAALSDVAFTMQTGREAFAARVAIEASTISELSSKLRAVAAGERVAAAAVERPARGRRISLPGYAFERSRHWIGGREAAGARQVMELTGAEWFIAEHRVDGRAVLPGAAYLEAVRAVSGANEISECCWLRPMVVDGQRSYTVVVEDAGARVESDGEVYWRGRVRKGAGVAGRVDVEAVRARCARRLSREEIYASARSRGLEYGPRFQLLNGLWCGDGEALAELSGARESETALVDAAMQSLAGLLVGRSDAEALVPFAVGRWSWSDDVSGAAFVHVTGSDIRVLAADGRALLTASGVELRALRREQSDESNQFLRLERVGAAGLLSVVDLGAKWAPKYARLIEALREMRDRLGVRANANWRAEVEAVAAREPALRAHCELLQECLEHYPGILRGEVAATDVFFPGGSMKRVEGIYRGYGMADRFLTVMAEAIGDAVRNRPGARILEAGAGTGGASAHVLPKVGSASEYWYTDVSAGFLHHGKTAFGAKFPFTKFQVMDLEQDPVGQGFAAESFDVVFASNVVHATRNIARTVGHLRRLVRPGGVLLLNEMTASRDFATLTFGLLDGWWLYDDPDARLAYSPLLSVAQWRSALEVAGFVVEDVQGDEDFTQSVIVASAGGRDKASTRSRGERGGNAEGSRLDSIAGIVDAVSEVVAEVFEMSVEQVRRGAVMSFTEFGADSILGAELVTKINERLGISLKTTAIFNYPNVRDLAAHIHAEFGAPVESAPDDLAAMLRRLESGEMSLEDALGQVPDELI
jgi:SAM-dependent methyltransferase/acyl carrier protein